MDDTQHPITTTPISEFEFPTTDASNFTMYDVMTTTDVHDEEVPNSTEDYLFWLQEPTVSSANANFTTDVKVSAHTVPVVV